MLPRIEANNTQLNTEAGQTKSDIDICSEIFKEWYTLLFPLPQYLVEYMRDAKTEEEISKGKTGEYGYNEAKVKYIKDNYFHFNKNHILPNADGTLNANENISEKLIDVALKNYDFSALVAVACSKEDEYTDKDKKIELNYLCPTAYRDNPDATYNNIRETIEKQLSELCNQKFIQNDLSESFPDITSTETQRLVKEYIQHVLENTFKDTVFSDFYHQQSPDNQQPIDLSIPLSSYIQATPVHPAFKESVVPSSSCAQPMETDPDTKDKETQPIPPIPFYLPKSPTIAEKVKRAGSICNILKIENTDQYLKQEYKLTPGNIKTLNELIPNIPGKKRYSLNESKIRANLENDIKRYLFCKKGIEEGIPNIELSNQSGIPDNKLFSWKPDVSEWLKLQK